MKTQATLFLTLFALGAWAQQNPNNLVPNPSFENIEKRVKGAGEIERAAPWRSITSNQVDLYHEDAKDSDFEVPRNAYGKEKAKSGNAYAGVSFFGYRGRLPRTYLGTKLTAPLEKGKTYCLKFHVSMSDMSQYAVNNIAMYITKDSIAEVAEANLSFEPQIVPLPNKVYDQQYLWKEICDQYVAKGNEQHIIIGNFKPDDETAQERVRKSNEFRGTQIRNGYYYIDDISVIPMDQLEKGDCSCNQLAGGRMEVESRNFSTDPKDKSKAKKQYFVNSDGSKADETSMKKETSTSTSTETKSGEKPKAESWSVETTNLFFEKDKFRLPATQEDELNKVVDYLVANPSINLEVVGHMDASETVKFLGKRRGFLVMKKIIDQGIEKSRLSYISKESSEPFGGEDASKNQRVTFNLK